MATSVASRFAVLSDDVEDDYSNRRRPPQPRKPEQAAAPVSKTAAKKKKNKENTQPAAAKSKAKPKAEVQKKKQNGLQPEQWQEWKDKDEQFVAVNYKDDLSKALALSKLDYEEKKDFYLEQAKAVEPPAPSQPPDTKGKKKNKTIKVLSVEEFHKLGKAADAVTPSTEPPKPDPEYFQRLDAEINKEVSKTSVPSKKGQPAVNVRKPLDEEALNLAQLRDKLDRKTGEMDDLKEENNKLQEELKSVKTRNKALCHILANGEMKDKAEILMEVERLQSVRDELSEQVASLAAQLEQERSKVRALSSDPKTKDKMKKAYPVKAVKFNASVEVIANKKRTTSSGDQ